MDDLRFIISVDDRDLIRAQKEQHKYERNILTIDQALRKGLINEFRYNTELVKQSKALSKLGGSYDRAAGEVHQYAASVKKLTNDQARLAQATNMAGKSTNRFGMYAQQVGYQVGDFFVQVQSGTSALVAFGQQGTQLAGLLPGVTGAVVGISLAIGTMLLRTLQQAKKEAQESASVFGNWKDSLKSAEEAAKQVSQELYVLKSGFEDLTEAVLVQNIVDATENLVLARERLQRANAGGGSAQAELARKQAKDNLSTTEEALKVAQNKLQLLRDERKELDVINTSKEKQELLEEHIATFRAAQKRDRLELEDREKRAFERRLKDEELLMGMSLKVDKVVQKKIDDQKKLNDKQNEFIADQEVQLNAANLISQKTDGELLAAKQINEMVRFKLRLAELEIKAGSDKYIQAIAMKELEQEAIARTFYKAQLEKEAAEAKKIADKEAQRVNKILIDQYSKIESELEKQAQKQKDFADNIANSFGDAFTSMADGTKTVKDAFRDMARDIIKQLYQILVVEQMVASISGAIRGAMGGSPMQGPMPSGNTIPYANGGVVGSPTTFPMSGGKTGLMGEAGPEAIMPLKRGANGKLGVQMEGGATTTVVQNFNFSANGDESVKKLIAQAAPKIADMTKSSLLNDRRRGGTTKAVFG